MMENASWQAVFLSNHDQPRPIDNILQVTKEHRAAAAKLLCLFSCTQAGTLFLYQGEELGMVNVPVEWPIEDYQDLVWVVSFDGSQDCVTDATDFSGARNTTKSAYAPTAQVCWLNLAISELESRKAKTGEANPDMTDLLKVINKKARDNARTPMPVRETHPKQQAALIIRPVGCKRESRLHNRKALDADQ